jgi:beta-lactam-binding protein with PASTA domain
MQALNAWLVAYDLGVLVGGPDPDSPDPVLHGIVVAQHPQPGTLLARWAVVTVWVRSDPRHGGVREPRKPLPRALDGVTEASSDDR